jgi:hypothetical protein
MCVYVITTEGKQLSVPSSRLTTDAIFRTPERVSRILKNLKYSYLLDIIK